MLTFCDKYVNDDVFALRSRFFLNNNIIMINICDYFEKCEVPYRDY